MNKFKKLIFLSFIFLSPFLLNYRLLEVPTGLTVDETAFGYNAVLLSRTGHDENGRFLPMFVLSINGTDWRQPLTQYYQAIFFKIFGASVYNLRLTSVILTIFSAILLIYLNLKLYNFYISLFSAILFIFTPIIFMHSHLALDNIMPIPLTILWLISLFRYSRKYSFKPLFLAGFFLGLSFYSYKGMRAVVPVWALLSLIFISYKQKLKNNLPFLLGILPFIIIIPLIQQKYPGALLGGARPRVTSIYDFFYPYLSYFDPTFLFIKGDDLLFHSTKIHGMFLLSSLPLFLFGFYKAFRQKNSFWYFIIAAFLSAPLLFGLVDSVHRASRLMAIIPIYCLISSLGLSSLLKINRLTSFIILFFIFINFINFLTYYWFTYPKYTENIFGNLNDYRSYQVFAIEAKNRKLRPYLHQNIYNQFFEAIYFDQPVTKIPDFQIPPPGSIILTHRESIPDTQKLDVIMPKYYLHIIK